VTRRSPSSLQIPFCCRRKDLKPAVPAGRLQLHIYTTVSSSPKITLKNQRPNLVNFLRASILGWQDNLADPNYVVPLITDNYGKSLG